jgi:hypothetical protein
MSETVHLMCKRVTRKYEKGRYVTMDTKIPLGLVYENNVPEGGAAKEM